MPRYAIDLTRRHRAASGDERLASGGFTLIEILIALSMVAMVLSLLYGAFFATASSVSEVDASATERRTAQASLRRLASELRSAYLGSESGRYLPVIRAGQALTDTPFLQFLSLRPAWERDEDTTELIEVAYRFESATHRLLYRRESPVGPQSAGVEDHWYPLVEDVHGVRVEVFYDDKWRDTWTPRKPRSLPDAVRVSVQVGRDPARTQELSATAFIACKAPYSEASENTESRSNRDERSEVRRVRGQVEPTATQRAAVNLLRDRVHSLAVDFDPDLGQTRLIFNRVGHLPPFPGGIVPKDPIATAVNFARANLDLLGLEASDLDDYEVTDSVFSQRTGTTHIYLRQVSETIPVFNGQLHVNVTRNGHILSVNNLFMPHLRKSTNTNRPTISIDQAVQSAALQLNLNPNSVQATAASLMWLPIVHGEARLVWRFQLDLTRSEPHYFDFTVDAVTGQVWTRTDLSSSASYRVFPYPIESPNHASPAAPADGRQLVTDPADPAASPLAWQSGTTLSGNNVYAYEDADADDLPPAIAPECSPSLECDFNFPLDFSTQLPASYVGASVTNLFYWSNLTHDIFYHYGFDEQAGNFQKDNFGRGGRGGDPVLAEAMDGSGNCNANFLARPDGQPGRVQMFLCDDVRDGAFDSSVIVHELGHGISSRLVGGPSVVSCLGNRQQPAEGLSDFFALALTVQPGQSGSNKRGVATYLFGEPPSGDGVRPQPYSTNQTINNYTYESVAGLPIPHGLGSVFGQIYWEVFWALVEVHGYNANLADPDFASGNQRALLYMIEGLKNTICRPSFTDVRDGIIQAAIDTGFGDECLLWTTFAKFGLGVNAISGGPNSVTPKNGFEPPRGCPFVEISAVETTDTCATDPSNQNGIIEPGETVEIRVEVTTTEALSGVVGTLTTSHPSVTVLTGQAAWPDVAVGVPTAQSSPFRLSVATDAACLSDIDFDLRITGANVGPFRFSLSRPVGRRIAPTDLPMPILDVATATSTIDIGQDRPAGNLAVTVAIQHLWVGDLTLTLESPTGKRVVLLARPHLPGVAVGCADKNMSVTFTDGAGVSVQGHCAGTEPWFSGAADPLQPLASLADDSIRGTWKLHVHDAVAIDDGTLTSWSLGFDPPLGVECHACAAAANAKAGLAVDFGEPDGLWTFTPASEWTQILADSSSSLVLGDLDGNRQTDVVAVLADRGVWAFMNHLEWTLLNRSAAEGLWVGDLDRAVGSELLVDFGSGGLQVFRNGTVWEQLNRLDPLTVAIGDIDGDGVHEVIASFGGEHGTYVFTTGRWIALSPTAPLSLATGDLNGTGKDDVIFDLGSDGIRVWYDNANWQSVHPDDPTCMATGDLDGDGLDELIVCFGQGVWALSANNRWLQLHAGVAGSMTTADINGDGFLDLIADFGVGDGLWFRSDGKWSPLHPRSAKAIGGGAIAGR